LPNLSPKSSADLQRLQRANAIELSETLRALLDRDEALDEAAEILEERARSGVYIVTGELACLLSKTKRQSLFDLVRDQIFQDQWALITLYRGKYPNQGIEQNLTDALYRNAKDDSNPARRAIAEAMRDVGTTATLPVLEAILYDLIPTKGTKNAIANALFSTSGPSLESLLASVVTESRSSFVDVVVEAIEAVRNRNLDQGIIFAEGSTSGLSSERLVDNAHAELERARQRLQDDPTYTLVCLRRGAEAMGKNLYRHLGHEKNGKPAKKMMLGELLKPIKDSDAPEVFKICMQALQPFVNYAAHDQDDQFANLTPRVAEALVVLFEEALIVYENWRRQRGGEPE
jgi:hypothetical protein